jgi:cell division protein ZapE
MLNYYKNILESGKIKPDEAQAKLAQKLDSLKNAIEEFYKPKKLLARIVGKAPEKPKGLFIFGKVGRGKSMMMDGFFKVVQLDEKKRIHFHEFMQKVHAEIHKFRTAGTQDPVKAVATMFAENTKLLCFDEYEVTDVSDAMILSKLFKEMSEQGVIFVMTSNKPPQDHYKEGLQRQAYLEFCMYLSGVVEIFSLDSKRDYRMVQKAEAENFFVPINFENTQNLKERFKSISAENLTKTKLEVGGRILEIRTAGKIAWASFTELCGANLGAADYLQIAKNYNILFLEAIPKMTEDQRNEARRFINLVDILYENKVILIATADAEPENLYSAGATASFEFNRTASRLKEMRGWKKRRDDEERF